MQLITLSSEDETDVFEQVFVWNEKLFIYYYKIQES